MLIFSIYDLHPPEIPESEIDRVPTEKHTFLHKIQNICNTPSKKNSIESPIPHNCCQFWPKNAIFVQWCSSKPCPILGAPRLSKVLLFYVNSTESYRISISIWFTMFHFLIASIAIAAMVNKNTPHTWVFWYFLCHLYLLRLQKLVK